MTRRYAVRRWCEAVATLLAALALGCGQPPPVGAPCPTGDLCAGGLVCVLSACRQACGTLGECGASSTCVADGDGRTACTLPLEEACAEGAGCPSPLVCVADHCRAPCRDADPRCAPGSACAASGRLELCVPVSVDAGVPPDAAAPDAGPPPDAGAADAGPPDAPRLPGMPFCSTDACETADECFLGACETETVRRIGSEWAPVVGLPGGAPYLEVPAFVDGTCVTQTRTPFGSPQACQWFINAPSSECGACARCVPEQDPTSGGLATVCRDRCDPTNLASCRAGYACDPVTRTCQDACAEDLQCRIYRVDSDGDGVAERLEYDPTSLAFCNARGLCEEGGTTPVLAGAACQRHSECGPRGLCLAPSLSDDPNRSVECFELNCGAFRGGYCTRLGCREPGQECADGELCTRALELFGGTTEMCLRACEVGAEPVGDRLGVMGHGLGCRPGYRCRLPSDAPAPLPGEPAMGTCNFGFYNDVTVPNVGLPCTGNEQCWSPFGGGICTSFGYTTAGQSTACVIDGCDAPGLPADFCGPAATCVDFGDNAFCLRDCASASECAPGWGCLDLDASGRRVCMSNCITAGDCRDGEGCYRADAISMGSCVAGGTCGSPVDLAAQASVETDGSLHLIGSLGSEVHYGCAGGFPGTVLTYVPAADGVMVADAGGMMADGVIVLRARSDCAGLSADLACGAAGPVPSEIELRVEGGRPYYLILDAASPATTTFDLRVWFTAVLRPGERCDATPTACPDGFACLPSVAGDMICQVPDLGCGAGVPIGVEVTVAPGPGFGPPVDGTLPMTDGPRVSGACAGAMPGQRSAVRPFVSPVDGMLTLVALGAFDVSLSVRTECRVASSEVGCSAFDVGVSPPLPVDVLAVPDFAWLAYVPARMNVEVRAGAPVYAIVEGAAPGGAYRLLSRVLPFRELGATCDPARQLDLCRRGSLCDATSSTCVARDEGCGLGTPVTDLTRLVPAGDDVRFVYRAAVPALQDFGCAPTAGLTDSWHRIRMPGGASDHWDYELRASMGFAPLVHTRASCASGAPALSCRRVGAVSGPALVGSTHGALPGGSDLFFSVHAGPQPGPTYDVQAHLTRVSIGACGGTGDPPCARGLVCRAGACEPAVCGDGVAEGGELCDSDPLCRPGCGAVDSASVGASSCAGLTPLLFTGSSPSLAVAASETSTLTDAPSIPSSCGGAVPARHFLVDVPVRSVLSVEGASFAGPVAVSVRTDCASPASEVACAFADSFLPIDAVGTFDPGTYVVSVQFPGGGPGGTQGGVFFELVPE